MIRVFDEFPFIEAGFCNAADSLALDHPILMQQVHSADVCVLDKVPAESPKCDALVTNTVDLRIAAKTADCAPVLIVEPKKHLIAAVHAGWKGAFQGIIENTILTLLRMGADLSQIHAAIGPHLTLASFQVSSDMQSLFPKTEANFFETRDTGIYFDFTSYVRHRLTRAGIEHISCYPIDTMTDTAYNSYRRDPQNPARQYSFIMMKKEA